MKTFSQPTGKPRNKPHWCLVFLLLVLAAPTRVAAQPLLPPYTAIYEVSLKGIPLGRLTQHLARPAPQTYHFTSTLESTGLARLLRKLHAEESSTGIVLAGGLQPESYTYSRRSGQKEKRFGLTFDWKDGQVRRTDSSHPDTALAPGTLDKLSLLLGVMLDLGREAQVLRHLVADDDGIKTYSLTQERAEPIDFEGRPQPVVKVSYSRGDSGRRTTLWCAPALHFVPLRIEYRERNGELTRGRLVSFTSGSTPGDASP